MQNSVNKFTGSDLPLGSHRIGPASPIRSPLPASQYLAAVKVGWPCEAVMHANNLFVGIMAKGQAKQKTRCVTFRRNVCTPPRLAPSRAGLDDLRLLDSTRPPTAPPRVTDAALAAPRAPRSCATPAACAPALLPALSQR